MTKVELRGTIALLTEDLLDNAVHHLTVFSFKDEIIVLDDIIAYLPEVTDDVIVHEMLEEYAIEHK